MHAPAYSIGTSKRCPSQKNTGPAPNSYNIKRDIGHQAPVFPRAKRPYSASVNPGPGAYDPVSSLQVSPRALIIPRRGAQPNENTPGPGTYSPSNSKTSYSYSFRLKYESQRCDSNPGPGAYNAAAVLKSAPRHIFDKSSRVRQPKEKVPGPGEYSMEQSIYVVSHRFARSSKRRASKKLSPGPGCYDWQTSTNGGHGAIIIGKAKTNAQNRNPGPGTYNPSKCIKSNPHWTMPRGHRTVVKVESQVSPLSYKPYPNMGRSSSCPFGKAERFSNSYEEGPGPGTYSPSKDAASGRGRTAEISLRSKNPPRNRLTVNVEKVAPTTWTSSDTLVGNSQVHVLS